MRLSALGQETPWLLVRRKGRATGYPRLQAALIPNHILLYSGLT